MRQQTWCVLSEQTIDDVTAWLETSPWRSSRQLSQETGVSKSSVHAATATQLLHLKPYKYTAVQKIPRGRMCYNNTVL